MPQARRAQRPPAGSTDGPIASVACALAASDAATSTDIDLLDTSGGTIFLAPPHVVGYSTTGSLLTVGDIVDGILDEPLAGHTSAGSVGKTIADTEANTDLTQAKVNEL